MRAARRQMGLPKEEAGEDDRPEQLEHLWLAFLEMSQRRSFAGAMDGIQPLPLQYAHMEAWARLNATELHPWDVKVIERLDELFLKAVADARSRRAKSQSR